jgi:uncharacterized membrane protein YphA (DoxX/SURF4 family)
MKTAAGLAHDDHVHVLTPAAHRHAEVRSTLTCTECVAAFVAFVMWTVLFGVGMLVDTSQHRQLISAGGTVRAWLVVLVAYLPLNLVWLCAISSTLGAFGNRSNLTNDRAGRRLRDDNNPYVAAIIRGLFAYLFLISGLLLLDDQPFTNPTAAEYVRLAGFLSLLSFVISYQPRFFNTLIVWAFHRIEAREGGEREPGKIDTDTVRAIRTEVTATHSSLTGAATPFTSAGTAGPQPGDRP